MVTTAAVTTAPDLGLKIHKVGKVRTVYELGDDQLLIFCSDQISAFDVVMPNGISDKGIILNEISNYWFEKLSHLVPNHIIETDFSRFPEFLQRFPVLRRRSVIVRKTKPLLVEAVARGYIAGSGWKDYLATGEVCGIPLHKKGPPSRKLLESEQLDRPVFTPATKAQEGHDENITMQQTDKLIGREVAIAVKRITLDLYQEAAREVEAAGLILADTKFEFGVLPNDGRSQVSRLILIDEALTPDSSRYWERATYRPGGPQKSYDKQFVRDHLESTGWNKRPPAPELPEEIVQKTRDKYIEAYERILGRPFIV